MIDPQKFQQECIESIFVRLAVAVNAMHLSDQTGSETLRAILEHTSVLASDTLTWDDLMRLDNEIMAWLNAKHEDIKQKMVRGAT